MATDTPGDTQPITDYSDLIDAETWAFIRETEKHCPPDTYLQPMAEQRRRYDAMCRVFFHGYPSGVTTQDTDADVVPVRCYCRSDRKAGVTVLYAHGGSFSLGGLDSHDDVCAEICDVTGYDVVAMDYRLLPEFTLADAFDDVVAAFQWVRRARGGKVILVGDSAGGFLCAALATKYQGAGDIAGQVLIYPGLGSQRTGGSATRHAHAPLLSTQEAQQSAQMLALSQARKPINFVLPLDVGDFFGLPPTFATSAQCDPIADQARIYVDKIRADGGSAVWIEDKGLVHAHLRARHSVKRARDSFDRVLGAIAMMGAGTALDDKPFSQP